MKRQVMAVLRKEIDPLALIYSLLVLAALVVAANALTEKALGGEDYYAMDATEMYMPAL